jgi:predicted MPP superfamily phosphohydrolase
VRVYLAVCWAAAGLGLGVWTARRLAGRPKIIRSCRAQRLALDMAEPPDAAGDGPNFRAAKMGLSPSRAAAGRSGLWRRAARLPGNQVLDLELTQCEIEIARLAPELDGLTIVQLSDFHFTGRVDLGYFRAVVRHANDLRPDLVAITGDIVDVPGCLDWIGDTLGRLSARYGVYYVLGNHDLRCDVAQLRAAMQAAGLTDVGGRWIEAAVRGVPVVLAGNELPWIAPAATLPPRAAAGPLRIALSHSPDQLAWARANAVDLMLAGHTHGGQIRLPLLGPLLTPSRYGVCYAAGLFHRPPTILHVSRGLSGEYPLRINCPPELAQLVLRAKE